MIEQALIKACSLSRDNHYLINKYINSKEYTREFKYIIKFISDYYSRDSKATKVDVPTIKSQIASNLDNDKHVARLHDMLDAAMASEASAENAAALVLMAKKHELSIQLATALANDDESSKVDTLLDELKVIRGATSLDDLEESIEVIDSISADNLVQSRLASGNLLEVYPKVINNKLDGGLEGGDHVVLFGLTEMGKTAASIQMAAGFAYQGHRGLYLINEDKTSRIAQRFVSCLSGMTKYDIMNDPRTAQERADSRGLANITVVGITPGSLGQIERLVEKYDPRWVVLDQLRNIQTGTRNNRVVQLEEAATGMRNILKSANVAGVSVTQAGNSAYDKLYLDIGDVDFSNVGIPSQADVMVGLGATLEMMKGNVRGISLCKNKLSGDHAELLVSIVPALSQVKGT